MDGAFPDLIASVEQSEDEDEDEDNLTPLEYARQQGLSRNYLENTAAYDHIDALQAKVDAQSADDSHLPQLQFGPGPRLEERLTLTREAARLLQDVNKEDADYAFDSLLLSSLDVRKARSLRVELPLLRSHHEADLKCFAQRECFETKLKDIKLPLESVEETAGEGLTLPGRYLVLGSNLIEDVKAEKLAVSREAIALLQQVVQCPWSRSDEESLWVQQQRYERKVGRLTAPARFVCSFILVQGRRTYHSPPSAVISSATTFRAFILGPHVSHSTFTRLGR